MSLLMKALEKAAKDRGETQQQPATAVDTAAAKPVAAPAMELSLEPLPADTPASPPPEPAPSRTTAKTRGDLNQARAATVMQATAPAAAATGPRIRPIMALGLAAGVLVLGFAIYVYLQITNPGMFIRQAPPAAKPPAALAQTPAPSKPIATGSVIAPAETVAQSRAVEQAQPPVARPAATPASASASDAVRSTDAARNTIQVSAGSAEPQLNPQLGEAYAALQSGKLDAARQLYSNTLRSEPRNINALLGLAAIAMQEGRAEEANRLYFNVLDLEPRNAYAQAGLIAMMGRADPLAAESRLKQLISREPLASLYFTLGNLYGDQSRWAEAQQAYFQAHQLEPANPDYAYNLAVGLEHVGQPRLAAGFYQRAVDQAKTRGRTGFNLAQAQDRIRQLAAQPQ
jgi:tetratricopeptide (TPR) repeat protein